LFDPKKRDYESKEIRVKPGLGERAGRYRVKTQKEGKKISKEYREKSSRMMLKLQPGLREAQKEPRGQAETTASVR